MAVNNQPRCSGCGKLIELGPDGKAAPASQKVLRIALGKVKNGAFVENKEWGILHEKCFNRSIDSPEAVLDLIRQQAASRQVA